MKIAFLSPPGRQRYIRDYYCSKVAKANYSYAPVDLLLLSGRFEQAVFIDAVQEGLGEEACLRRLTAENPAAIISLVGAVSWPEDRSFLARVKQALPDAPILASGDVLLEDGERLLRSEPWLDGIILDFTNADVRHYLEGNYPAIEAMIFRTGPTEIISARNGRRPGPIADLPLPRHDLFLPKGYAFPFVRRRPFATIQTDYGCPFGCRFCVMGSLGHRVRPVDQVIDELKLLAESGVKEIYFNDQTFGGTARRLTDLCQAFLSEKLNLGWCCWNRVDLAQDHLELIKAAGGHTILFGVDSANEATLKLYRKGYTIDQVRRTFKECRRLGIRTLGTFMLGLPNEDLSMAQATVDLALELDPDFVSFNVFVPRKGSSLRSELALSGQLPSEEVTLDQTGATVSLSSSSLSTEELKNTRDAAVKRFYLRPRYAWRRLLAARTFYDLEVLGRMALSMVWS